MSRRKWCLSVAAMVLAVGSAASTAVAQSPSPGAPGGTAAAPSTAPGGSAGLTLPAEGGALAQGHYIADVSPKAAISFDVAEDGWTGAGMPGYALVMDREDASGSGEVIVTTFAGTVPADPCDRGGLMKDVPRTAAAFGDWLVAQPWAVGTSSPVTLDGQPAVQVDISSLKKVCADAPTMFVWNYADGAPFRLAPTEALRVVALDRNGEVILVSAEVMHASSLPAFLASAAPVIDSMRFSDAATVAGSPAPGASASTAP